MFALQSFELECHRAQESIPELDSETVILLTCSGATRKVLINC